MPMLLKADAGHIVNTSSVNGFWGSLGPTVSHTAYSAAKFAVKGFTEALISDLRLNAPHIKCSVVMPGPYRYLDRDQFAHSERYRL
jgi:NAD(P)-dependent dehydrogenase (short-subunit alcohol dehydrogenase family)